MDRSLALSEKLQGRAFGFHSLLSKHLPLQMKWNDLARQLTDATVGTAIYAAMHSLDDGSYLGSSPKEGNKVKMAEIQQLKRAFRDPTVLYSSGVTLRDQRFTFVKMEQNAILGRTHDQACIVMCTEKAYIVCIYPGQDLAKYAFRNCESLREKIGTG